MKNGVTYLSLLSSSGPGPRSGPGQVPRQVQRVEGPPTHLPGKLFMGQWWVQTITHGVLPLIFFSKLRTKGDNGSKN